MNKQDVTKFIKNVKTGMKKRSPEILTGIGIAGMVTTTVLAVRATPKALRLIDDEKKDIFNHLNQEDIPGNNVDYTDMSLKPIEVLKVAWKPYIPAAITGVASITCLIGASSVNAKHNAALVTAYQLSTTALNEYKAKVVETIGEKKEAKVREELDKDHLKNDPVSGKEIFITSTGNVRFYDAMASRRFTSDIDSLRKIENNLNKRMRDEVYISLNDLYREIGLDEIPVGDELGWDIDKGYINMTFTPLIDDDGTPCIVMDYLVRPTYGYDRVY